jgi:hypothetical protein
MEGSDPSWSAVRPANAFAQQKQIQQEHYSKNNATPHIVCQS